MRSAARLLAALVALALVAAGVVAVVEVVAAALGADPLLVPRDGWAADGRSTEWADRGVRYFFIIVGAVGVVLAAVALVRRPPRRLAVPAPSGLEDVTIRRRGLERSLQRTAESIDGVRQASVRIKRTQVRIRIGTHRRDANGLPEAVQEAVTSRLGGIGVAEPLAVKVMTRTERS